MLRFSRDTPVQQGLNHLDLQFADFWTLCGAVVISYNSKADQFEECSPRHRTYSFILIVCLPLWSAASITSGRTKDVWSVHLLCTVDGVSAAYITDCESCT